MAEAVTTAKDSAPLDGGYPFTPVTTKPSPEEAGPSNPTAPVSVTQASEDFEVNFLHAAENNDNDEDYEERSTRKIPRSTTDDLQKSLAKRRFVAGIRLPTLVSPKSVYEGWTHRELPVSKERFVLREFQLSEAEQEKAETAPGESGVQLMDPVEDGNDGELRRCGRKRKQEVIVEEENSFTSYKLEGFSVYHPAFDKRSALEMTCLHNLSVKAGKNILLFDGVLSDGKTRRYVEGVPFTKLSIGNYGELSLHTVEGAIWIQSDVAKGAGDVWYELGKPAEVYEKYHKPFLWLANFAKFYIDFLDRPKHAKDDDERPVDVALRDFKSHFGTWIRKLHWEDVQFQKWLGEFGEDRIDFRQAVAAHCHFLWNQAWNTDKAGRLTKHSIWDEVMGLTTIKQAKGALVNDTIVTPLVYDCFHHIFGDKLQAIAPKVPLSPLPPGKKLVVDKVEIRSPPRKTLSQLQPPDGTFSRGTSPLSPSSSRPKLKEGELVVKPGDIVAVIKDVDTVWKGKSEYWYAYIQSVNKNSQKMNSTTLDVIWLYLPEDTILGQMRYPYENELFFSDNCNCGDAKLRLDEVVFKVEAAFFAGPEDEVTIGCDFFLRQRFSDAESNFTTLTKSDLACECRKPVVSAYEQVKKQYEIGDTVLVESYSVDDYSKDVLEPAQIIRYDEESQSVELRQLYRRGRDFNDKPDARPNELVYTDHLVLVQPKFIHRRCHIRFFPLTIKPTTPYDRDGTGDCFFIYVQRTPAGDLVPMSPPPEFHQGYDPETPLIDPSLPRLNGMDLFCGGGNFGRGIEEGGAVVNKWAVDLDIPALHTYRANLRDPDTQLYLGSVNNYLRDGLLGKFSSMIPPPGQVDFISAGSPCQGFSNANLDRDSERSLGNSSLVASVASFVDFYRPKFALLENVHGLAQDRTKKKDGKPYNVFSQLLCALVAIGYQCQQFTLDAWSFGSCQNRTRLFVSIASPGHRLPPRPPRSHEHPSTIRSKSLFEAPNGKKFGGRELYGPCTYPYVSSLERLGSLPKLGDNHPGVCIPYPDHRHSRIEGPRTRLLMTHIPKVRTCATLRRAIDAGRIPPSLDFYKETAQRAKDYARSWSRIFEDDLCRTVTTTITPQCAFTGQWMHWDEHRLLTVMEARRVQSFPDEEVLLGVAAKAFRIVGNSVDRAVALAWGLAIREAWLGRERGEKNAGEGVMWKRGFEKRVDEYRHLRESWRTETKTMGVEAQNEQGEDEDEPTVWIDAREVLDNPQEDLEKAELQEEQPVRVIEPAVNTPSTTGSDRGRSKKVRGVQAADGYKEVEERDGRAHDVFVKRALQPSSLRKRVNPLAELENAEVKDADEGGPVMLDV